MITVKELKKLLDEFDDDDKVYIELGMGTCYRIGHCVIPHAEFNENFIEVKAIKNDGGFPVLTVE